MPSRRLVTRQPPSRRSAMTADDRSATGCRQNKWIADDHDATAFGLRELPAPNGLGDAVADGAIAHRVRHRRARDDAIAGDRELDDQTSGEARMAQHFLLVAVPHLVDVLANDPLDDLLFESSPDCRHAGRQGFGYAGATVRKAADATHPVLVVAVAVPTDRSDLLHTDAALA